jgi:hypothetical protein
VVVEELLQLLITEVDAELFEPVKLDTWKIICICWYLMNFYKRLLLHY